MKNLLLILSLTLAVSQAAVIQFNISPPGTDAAIGLSPANETPPVTNGPGSGNAIIVATPRLSIWNDATSPANPETDDASAVELGVKFQSDMAGYVTGIRFYKGTNNTGTHEGHLWTSGGTLLATATFTNEAESGWQEASLASPVAIAANTTYVVSYHAPNGHYAADGGFFDVEFGNPPLLAPASGVSGGNGVYAYGASGTFPANTFNSANYWVDLVFVEIPGSAGITFDTDTDTFTFAIGYGSAARFNDLTGLATALHIHAPAPAGLPAGVLFDLQPFHFPSADPAKGGVILGSIAYPSNQVSDLLAGLNYVNVHTTMNPGGEIRGSLIPVLNAAPEVVCPPAYTVQCGVTTTITANVSDADGGALLAVWTLNGVALQTNHVAAGGTPTTGTISLTGCLPLGTNEISVTVTDSATNQTSCATTVTVVDTISPVIYPVSATPNQLSRINGRLLPVRIKAVVRDTCGPATWKVISVTSNEPVTGPGYGNTSPDWVITGDHTVKLRAETFGKHRGRIYTVTIQATDASGNVSAPARVRVRVRDDQSDDH